MRNCGWLAPSRAGGAVVAPSSFLVKFCRDSAIPNISNQGAGLQVKTLVGMGGRASALRPLEMGYIPRL